MQQRLELIVEVYHNPPGPTTNTTTNGERNEWEGLTFDDGRRTEQR
jgi:hypothetical protein